MKVNYVLLYGTPYLKYELFDTFEKMSDFIIKRSIVNYTIFEKMEDKKEVKMIYRDNDIRVLEDRINKAIEYIENCEWEDYPIQTTTHHKLREEIIGKELLKILGVEDDDK